MLVTMLIIEHVLSIEHECICVYLCFKKKAIGTFLAERLPHLKGMNASGALCPRSWWLCVPNGGMGPFYPQEVK